MDLTEGFQANAKVLPENVQKYPIVCHLFALHTGQDDQDLPVPAVLPRIG